MRLSRLETPWGSLAPLLVSRCSRTSVPCWGPLGSRFSGTLRGLASFTRAEGPEEGVGAAPASFLGVAAPSPGAGPRPCPAARTCRLAPVTC